MSQRKRRRALGQHTLVDPRILAAIVRVARITSEEIVCEAGAGRGTLTEQLCTRAKRVISYEVDRVLYEWTRARLVDERYCKNLELVNADIFRVTRNLKFDVFVSNLPYSRSRDAFEWLATQRFSRAVVMVQQEFADKLVAAPGAKNYKALSALAAYCFRLEPAFSVSKNSFEPPPKVRSVLMKVLPSRTIDRKTIKSLNLLFSKRNKQVISVAAREGLAVKDLLMPGVQESRSRIDELEPDKAIRLAEMMSRNDI